MIQQVNLYQPSTSWEDSALNGALIGKLVGGMTALLLVLYAVSLVQMFAVKRDLGAQLALGEELDLKLAEFSERASHRIADGTLSGRVTVLREQLEAKQRLLETLSRSGDGNSDGFSPHLTCASAGWSSRTPLAPNSRRSRSRCAPSTGPAATSRPTPPTFAARSPRGT